jgi:hypothetical protein
MLLGENAAYSASASTSPRNDFIRDTKGCAVLNPNSHPKGTITWSGVCKNGFAEGRGTIQWVENNVPGAHYDGELRHGKPNGYGLFRDENGHSYVGFYIAGKPDGYGTLHFTNGDIYSGYFKNGQRSGHGSMILANGTRQEGIWRADKIVSLIDSAPSGHTATVTDEDTPTQDSISPQPVPSTQH